MAVVVVLGPGLLVGSLLRLRGLLLLGLAGPVSVALVAVSGILGTGIRVPYGWWAPLGLTLLAAAAALPVGRRRRRSEPSGTERELLPVALACLVAAVAIALSAFGAVASPALPTQTYDGIFHLNAVSWILDTGDGSSLHLYGMTHTGGELQFYPAAWHDVVALVAQLTGVDVSTATAATWIATSGVVFPAGSALLAATLFGGPGRSRAAVGAVAAIAASTTAAAPYLLLQWGVLYPTGLAYALLPAGLALTVLLLRARTWRDALLPGVLLVLWGVAQVLAHPRSLPSYAVLAAPLVIAHVVRWADAGVRDAARRRRTLVILGIGVAAVLAAAVAAVAVAFAYFGIAARPLSGRLNGGPATARQTILDSVLQAVLLAPPSGPGESSLAPSVVAAVLVLVGLVYCLTSTRTLWIAAAFVLVVTLYALSAGSNDDIAKLATALWYKDKYRLFAILGMLAPPLIAYAVLRLSALGGERSPRGLPLLAGGGLVALLVVGSWAGPTLAGMRQAIGDTVAAPAGPKNGRLLNADELALLQRLPAALPEKAVVVGNPWNGSALTWAVGRRQSLFPHLTGDWGPDRALIAQSLDHVHDDPAVCAALGRLGAQYLMVSPGLLWNGDPQAGFFAGIDRADPNSIGTEVARVGEAAVYRINACR